MLVVPSGVAAAESVAAQEQPLLGRRIRSDSGRITNAIVDGTARSATFRRLVDTIGASDGIVYVEEGECGNSVAACLLLSVTIAGPFRVLQVRVNLRKAPGCKLIESIGHELQHVVEALRERRVRSGIELYHFFYRIGPTGVGRFETGDAVHVGFEVAHEACRGR